MEFLFELIGQFLFELIGQLVFELLVEVLLRAIGQALGSEERKNPWLASVGYVVLAGCGGLASVLIFPKHLIHDQMMRKANLVLTPYLIGLIMGLRGKGLQRKGKAVIRLDSFSYGFLFALTFAAVRHWLAR